MKLEKKYRWLVITLLVLLAVEFAVFLALLERRLHPVISEAISDLLPTQTVEVTPEATPEPTPIPTPVPTLEPTPALRKRTDLLVLVNPWHEMEEGYVPELQQVTQGYEEEQFMDVRAADALMRMMADCADAGNNPFICSSYRDPEKQEYLFLPRSGKAGVSVQQQDLPPRV